MLGSKKVTIYIHVCCVSKELLSETGERIMARVETPSSPVHSTIRWNTFPKLIFLNEAGAETEGQVRGLLSPHAGYMYSGRLRPLHAVLQA
jgi:predicted class III extradiol MEMO1 family dioxygenase